MCTTRIAHRADLHDVAVGERGERVLGLGERVDRDGEAVLEREPAVPRQVVGVRVRLEHPPDLDARLGRGLEVLLDRERRVDDDGVTGGRVADEIRATAQVLIDELPEQHVPERTSAAGRFGPTGALYRPRCRAMTMRCTSFVPSPISRIFWSR